MLKPILLSSAMLIAIPAFAQTDMPAGSSGSQGTASATTDHDPTMDDSMAAEGTADASTSTQVNGGVNSGTTGMHAGMDQAGACSQGTAASTARKANRHGARAQGSAAQTCGTLNSSAHSGMNHASMGSQGDVFGHAGMNHANMDAQATTTGQGGSSYGTTGEQAGMTAQADTSGSTVSGSDDGSAPGGAAATATSTTAAQSGTTGVTGSVGMAGSTTAWNGSAMSNRGGLSSWRFANDLGRIGTPNFGIGAWSNMGAQGWGTGTATTGTQGSWNGGTATASTQGGSWGTGTAASTVQGQAGTGYTGMGGPADIDSQWSNISSSGGDLTPLDFGTWLLEQNGQNIDRQVNATLRSRASNLPAIQVLNLTAGAFAQADLNRDRRISRDELRAFVGM